MNQSPTTEQTFATQPPASPGMEKEWTTIQVRIPKKLHQEITRELKELNEKTDVKLTPPSLTAKTLKNFWRQEFNLLRVSLEEEKPRRAKQKIYHDPS